MLSEWGVDVLLAGRVVAFNKIVMKVNGILQGKMNSTKGTIDVILLNYL